MLVSIRFIILFFIIINNSGYAFSCHHPQSIIQKPIQFSKERIELTREYQLSHYGIDSKSIEINPRIIVLHWTCIPSLDVTFRVFNRSILPMERKDKLPGDLNVSSHFVVDRDGTIYQLMPDNWMARHVIGLNHAAIGIENIGGVNGKDDLTKAQARANAFLICYLKKKYPQIKDVIGHNEYLKFQKTSLWLEKDRKYKTEKTDPGLVFVARVKQLIAKS